MARERNETAAERLELDALYDAWLMDRPPDAPGRVIKGRALVAWLRRLQRPE